MEDQTAKAKKEKEKEKEKAMSEVKVNPLRKERIYVRFIPNENGYAGSNKQHIMYGGRADGAKDTFCVPMLRNGNYKNVLTNDEKEFLEEALGLDRNALSVYRTEDNYWDNFKIEIVAKEGLYLDLSLPLDYLRYKVLLANTEQIAPSVQDRIERPKATYMYELVRSDEETMLENAKMDATMASYKEFGKIESDIDTLRVLIELLDGRPYSVTEKIEFLRSRANALIQADPKRFLTQITDPLLHTKMLIRRGVELAVLSKRADYYYLRDGSPLCDNGEDPTLSIAARYLNQPSHQDIKFILESEVSKTKGK